MFIRLSYRFVCINVNGRDNNISLYYRENSERMFHYPIKTSEINETILYCTFKYMLRITFPLNCHTSWNIHLKYHTLYLHIERWCHLWWHSHANRFSESIVNLKSLTDKKCFRVHKGSPLPLHGSIFIRGRDIVAYCALCQTDCSVLW